MSALALTGIGFSYGTRRALDGVTFTVEQGQFCALLGPNGAGKSTLFSLLTRLFTTAEGTIHIGPHDLAREPRAALAKLGIVFQQTTLDMDLSVRQNLRYFAALHGLSGRAADLRIEECLDRLSMRERAQEKVRNLNGGHRRRTEFTRALLHKPLILLMDEPTVGLDAETRIAITTHIHGLCDDGITALWATHLTDEVWPEDRLVVLHQGRVRADGIAGEIAGELGLADRFAELTAKTPA